MVGFERVRCLSIRQPWAYLILHAGKDVENRTWRGSFQGPLLIHAGQRFDEDALADPGIARLVRGAFLETGGIVGACVVDGCVSASASPWFFGPHAFTLRAARPIPFIACPGKLNFFRPPSGLVEGAAPHIADLLAARTD